MSTISNVHKFVRARGLTGKSLCDVTISLIARIL